ncbi:MAG: hypothetical protein U0T74_01850 [Chitinophagales bacterium]
MAIVFQPMLSELAESNKYSLQPALDYCIQNGATYTDERVFLKQQGIDSAEARQIYWRIDTHFNAEDYRYLALCTYQLFQHWLVNRAYRN